MTLVLDMCRSTHTLRAGGVASRPLRAGVQEESRHWTSVNTGEPESRKSCGTESGAQHSVKIKTKGYSLARGSGRAKLYSLYLIASISNAEVGRIIVSFLFREGASWTLRGRSFSCVGHASVGGPRSRAPSPVGPSAVPPGS